MLMMNGIHLIKETYRFRENAAEDGEKNFEGTITELQMHLCFARAV